MHLCEPRSCGRIRRGPHRLSVGAAVVIAALVILSPAVASRLANDTGGDRKPGPKSSEHVRSRVLRRVFRKESIVPAFYVAPSGSDINAGTIRAPFETLAAAQKAMQKSRLIKTTYIRGGMYRVSSSLKLGREDSGETWMYYPPDGIDTAVLDGGDTVAGGMIAIDGASNLTINGLKLQHYYDYGINGGFSGAAHPETRDVPHGAGNLIENCDVGFNVITKWESSGISVSAPDTYIINNYVHDVGSQGIAIYAYFPGDSIDGSVIANNLVLRAVQRMSDGGGIYVSMHGISRSEIQHVTVANNYVRDMGAANTWGVNGIYLDDLASNVLVIGNVVGPPNLTTGTGPHSRYGTHDICAFNNNSGNHNVYTGNIIDLGSAGNEFIALFYYDRDEMFDVGMDGNSFTRNIIVSNIAGPLKADSEEKTAYAYNESKDPAGYGYTIKDNVYWNSAAGHRVFSNGTLSSDSNPIIEDPLLSEWAYAVASTSPVFHVPVCWQGIEGGWGPARVHRPWYAGSRSRRQGLCRSPVD